MNIFRQGDVLLKQINSLPGGLKKSQDKTLAYGEITGHSHRFQEGSNVDLFLAADGLRYLQVNQPSPLIHEEHDQIMILPGTYQIKIEREWDYNEEEMKLVQVKD